MSVCFNCAELGDDRVSARIYGQQCVWITQKPTTDDAAFICFLGLDNSGKTSLVHTLVAAPPPCHSHELPLPPPTTQPLMARITAAGLNTEVVAVDLPGQQSKRTGWFDALRIATALTFVIDSTDVSRFALVSQELHRLVQRLCSLRIPVLFLATKQDAPGAWSVPDILIATDIAAICAGLPAPWTLRGCSATDYWDLTSSFCWLLSHLGDMRRLREEQALCAAALYQQANIEYAAQLAARISSSLASKPLLESHSMRSEGVR